MHQKLTSEQLKQLTPEQANDYLSKVVKAKQNLLSQKEQAKDWDEQKQKQLDELAMLEVDLEEVTNSQAEITDAKPVEFKVPKGTEHLVHLSVCKGRRFNPNTGEEETKAYTQIFTKSELRVFLEHHRTLGYQVLKVLHNPTDISIKID